MYNFIDEYSDKIKSEIDKLLAECNSEKAELENKIASLSNENKQLLNQLKTNNGKIQELEAGLAKFKNQNADLNRKIESLKKQVVDLGGELESHKKQTEAAMQEAEKVKIQLSQAKTLRESLDGYKQSVHIISDWVPSQRESIEVLVACSEYDNITLDDLASKTKVSPMILKRNVLPKLQDKGFITIQKLENEIEIINLAKKKEP